MRRRAASSRPGSGGCPFPPSFTAIRSNIWSADFLLLLDVLANFEQCSCDSLPEDGDVRCIVDVCPRVQDHLYCTNACHNGADCGNKWRVPWSGTVSPFVVLRESTISGLGVFATRKFAGGALVGEYLGVVELLTPRVASSCGEASGDDDASEGDPDVGVDVTFRMELAGGLILNGQSFGSMLSFMNHSCVPNCEIVLKWIPNDDVPAVLMPRVFVYTLPDAVVEAGQEMCYAYHLAAVPGKPAVTCNCGCGEDCKGRIDVPVPVTCRSSAPVCSEFRLPHPQKAKLSVSRHLMDRFVLDLPTVESAEATLAAISSDDVLVLRKYLFLFILDGWLGSANLKQGLYLCAFHDLLQKWKMRDLIGRSMKPVDHGNVTPKFTAFFEFAGVVFGGSGQSIALAKNDAARKCWHVFFVLLPDVPEIRLSPPSTDAPLTMPRQDAFNSLSQYLKQFESRLCEVARSTGQDYAVLSAKKQDMFRDLMSSFYSIVPSHAAASELLGFLRGCPFFVINPAAGKCLSLRAKKGELNRMSRFVNVGVCGFAKFRSTGFPDVIAQVQRPVQFADVAELEQQFSVTDFVDAESWGRHSKVPLSFAHLYKSISLPAVGRSGNVVGVVPISQVVWPPLNLHELLAFMKCVETNLLFGSYTAGGWVSDSIPVPQDSSRVSKAASLVKGSSDDPRLPSDHICALQASMSNQHFSELRTLARQDVEKMVADGGSLVVSIVEETAAAELNTLLKAWVDRVHSVLRLDKFTLSISSAFEYYLIPPYTSDGAREYIRQEFIQFLNSYLERPAVRPSIPREEVGLSHLSLYGGPWLVDLEVYLHAVLRGYGVSTGRGESMARWRSTSMSYLVMDPGATPQHGHWDILVPSALVVIILLTGCTCNHCKMPSTQLFQMDDGTFLGPIPVACEEYIPALRRAFDQGALWTDVKSLFPEDIQQALNSYFRAVWSLDPGALHRSFKRAVKAPRVGHAVITFGPHRGPPMLNVKCPRAVLFFSMSVDGHSAYDPSDQVQMATVIACKYGLLSEKLGLFTVLHELCFGIRVFTYIRHNMAVTVEEAEKVGFSPAKLAFNRKELDFRDLCWQSFLHELVDLVCECVTLGGVHLSEYPGVKLPSGAISQSSLCERDVRVCFGIVYQAVSRSTSPGAFEGMAESLKGRFRVDDAGGSRRASVVEKAKANYKRSVDLLVLQAKKFAKVWHLQSMRDEKYRLKTLDGVKELLPSLETPSKRHNGVTGNAGPCKKHQP